MKVTLKLYATLGSYLPPQAERNQIEVEVASETSIRALLDAHQVPPQHCHLVLLNGVFQPPGVRSQVMLSEGDAVAVWPPVAGG